MLRIFCGGGDTVHGLIQYELTTDGKGLLFRRGLIRGQTGDRNGMKERGGSGI
jgi:hypothetical protein